LSIRSSILSNIISFVSADISARGYRGFKYLHELNDFPCFCIHPETETRAWTDQRYGIIRASVRGIQYSDNLDDIEVYARSLETSFQTCAKRFRGLLEDVRVISIRTDEGLMSPYGIVDMGIEILYRYTNHEITADSTVVTADSTKYTADKG